MTYDPEHDFAPLIRYLKSHRDLEDLDWQYMGHAPYRAGNNIAVYRARETATTPNIRLELLEDGVPV